MILIAQFHTNKFAIVTGVSQRINGFTFDETSYKNVQVSLKASKVKTGTNGVLNTVSVSTKM